MTDKNSKKHISVPIREWSNNHYSFNKYNEKQSLSYLNTTNKIIKDYFNLTYKETNSKSKRMRDLMKRSTTTRIFNSKGEIKQNGDKINITVYTFDKEKLFNLKSLYNFNKHLTKYKKLNNITFNKLNEINNKNKLIKRNIELNNFKNYKKLNNKSNINLSKVDKLMPLKKFKLVKRNNLYYSKIYNKNMNFYYKSKLINYKSNNNLLNKTTFFKKKKIMLQNKRDLLYKKLMNKLSWSFINNKIIRYKTASVRLFYLSLLENNNLKLTIDTQNNIIILNKLNNNQKSISNLENKFLKVKLLPKFMLIKEKKKDLTELAERMRKAIGKTKLNEKNNINKVLKQLNKLRWQRVIYINKILNKIIKLLLLNTKNNLLTNGSTTNIINSLYNEFVKNNINILFGRYFVKQQMVIYNSYKTFITNDKYTHLTNNLKYLLNKIYNKKISLNITNLKYSHLNAEIFANAVVTKLISKNSNIKTVITEGLKLVKLANVTSNVVANYDKVLNAKGDIPINEINLYNLINEMYKPSDNNKVINKITDSSYTDLSFNEMLADRITNYNNKTKEVVKDLRHKWTTGVRLEGKGRLTSRYSAARAMYKYRAKGNLRSKFILNNLDYLRLAKTGNKIFNSSPSTILFRGIYGPNIQHVKKSGFKRIGAFGIKVWINNN